MSEEEARRAAATFEFPGWTCRARQAYHWKTGEPVWALEISDSTGMARLVETPEEWRAIYREEGWKVHE